VPIVCHETEETRAGLRAGHRFQMKLNHLCKKSATTKGSEEKPPNFPERLTMLFVHGSGCKYHPGTLTSFGITKAIYDGS
jgi:hypothetical protein